MADLILKPSSGSGNKVRIQDQTGSDNLIIDADASMTGVKPHIIPNKLYPAVAGKLLDGSTSHSGDYGTAQSDGRSYYYTDIKGSQAINDPRIGSHFGSQRHKCRSLQLLEQETATNGTNVYSVDGREWMRVTGNYSVNNNDAGVYMYSGNTQNFCEVVGYFTDINMICTTHTAGAIPQGSVMSIDGSTLYSGAEQEPFATSVATPLGGRYVDRGSLANVVSGQTLGIHTFKYADHSAADGAYIFAFELIAQDLQDFTATNATNTLTTTGHTLTNGDQIRLTGSDLPNGLNATTTYYVISVSGNNFQVSTSSGGSAVTFSDDGTGSRTWTALNNIQIPAQTVVSYGKKFSIDAQSTHYDPFHGFTNDTTLFASRVDVATSLGLGTATTWGAAWDKGSSNHIRPYNGGRVVKWVDASGNIKTSVTMMPANAQNVATSASNEILTASATNSQTINFSDDAIESSLAEKAKSFYLREFGNGAANGGTGATYADASMVSGADDIAYVMDDGLTSLSCKAGRSVTNFGDVLINTDASSMYITFIGTGISMGHADSNNHGGTDDYKYYIDGVQVYRRTASENSTYYTDELIKAQNLPYGTHVFRWERVVGHTATPRPNRITIFQPKKPPIPEDAVVLADYMLMADFVKQTVKSNESEISKGVRALSGTRDVFYDSSAALNENTAINVLCTPFGFSAARADSATMTAKLHFFGTDVVAGIANSDQSGHTITFPGTTANAKTSVQGPDDVGDLFTLADSATLGNNEVISTVLNGGYNFTQYHLHIPTHTSSHYQPFETPFLHELVGGDRNMEQNNLVVTADGKTWDELRDTSYIGKGVFNAWAFSAYAATQTSTLILSETRGTHISFESYYNKDFAISYDRTMCLVNGQYTINWGNYHDYPAHIKLYINGTCVKVLHRYRTGSTTAVDGNSFHSHSLYLKRGDYLHIEGGYAADNESLYGTFQINRS